MATVIFDFDGTIADSFDYVLEFLSGEAGLPKTPNGKEADRYRGLSMKDMALTLGVPFWRLLFVYFKGRRVMRAHMKHVRPFEGMVEAIKGLHQEGHGLFIISSNSGKNIRHLLRQSEISEYFTAVRGGAGIFGKSNIIKQLCRQYRLKPREVLYIGDEFADLEAAKAAGVWPVAVSWGFAKRVELEAAQPLAVVDKPQELVSVLKAKIANWK